MRPSLQATPKTIMVSVERVVNLGNYESIRVGLAESFDASADKDQAYRSLLAKVESWTSALKPPTQSPTGNGNGGVPPRLAASKLATLQERLGPRLQDLEVTDGIDGLIVKPRSYLGDSWAEINEVVRSLGGHWIRGEKPAGGSWRIKK